MGAGKSKDVQMKGYLKKQGSINSSAWHARYFILQRELLFRFDDKPNRRHYEKESKETINMSGCTVSKNVRSSKPFSFTIYERDKAICILAAKDQSTMNKWVRALSAVSMKVVTASSSTHHIAQPTQPPPPYSAVPPSQAYAPPPQGAYPPQQYPPQYANAQYAAPPQQQYTSAPPPYSSAPPPYAQSDYAAYLQHTNPPPSYNPEYHSPSAPPIHS